MDGKLYLRDEPRLLPYIPRLIYLCLRDMGCDTSAVFQDLDLSVEQLHDENFRLTTEQHERFILRVLELTGDPHFALSMSKKRDYSSANLALLTIANSGSISRALELIVRYNKIVTRVFSITHLDVVKRPAMDIQAHLDHQGVVYFAISLFALFLDSFFAQELSGAHLVRRLDMAIPEPEGFAQVQHQFGFKVYFDQPQYRIHFNRATLGRSTQQADPQTVRLLTEMAERQLEEADAEMNIAGAVKSILVNHITAPPQLDDVARQLSVSPRGLRRKLEASGTTYQQILNSVRLKMATRLLQESTAPVASIAYELGFHNASDFGRAFKRWSGQSPTAVRNAVAEEKEWPQLHSKWPPLH